MNVIKRMHWAKYGKTRNRIAWLVREALAAQCKGIDLRIPMQRCVVRIERHGRRLLDEDNLPSSAKMILDVLQPASKKHPSGLGVILEDSPECAQIHVTQCQVKKADTRMVVRIEEAL